MKQYHDLLKRIVLNGEVQFEPRTEMYTIGLPGDQSIYDLREGFPQMTTKNVPLRLPGEELFWKLRGERSVNSLFDRNVHIWDANAFDHYLKRTGKKDDFPKHTQKWEDGFKEYCDGLKGDKTEELGDLGPVYGYQWRHWKKALFVPEHPAGREWVDEHIKLEEVDQLKKVVEGLKKNSGSRYHLMSAWNPADLPEQAIGPCPMIHQFSAFGKNLHLNVYQRSCDTFLGVPYNISQDSLLLEMMAKETGFNAGKFVHSYGNVHIYLGVDRGEFWNNVTAIAEFRRKFSNAGIMERTIGNGNEYMNLREWYAREAGNEKEVNARKDHMPFVLEQLSKPLRKLPRLELRDIPLFEAIQMPLGEVAELKDYNPDKWDAKAVMAA